MSGYVDAAIVALVAAVVIALLAWAVRVRRRSRLLADRIDWLRHLAAGLAAAPDADDPERLVADLTTRAAAELDERVPGTATLRATISDLGAQALRAATSALAEREAIAHVDFVGRASSALGATLDAGQVAATVESLAVPHLADACVLRLVGDAPPPADDPTALRAPLHVGGGVLAELVAQRRGRPLSAAEQRGLVFLAERAAQALARALRFSEQEHTSSTLQHSLLPAAVLPIEHLQVATRYLAAAEGQSVGGDFYDVLSTPSGAAVLVIGDVQGKGVEAASLTSTARHTLRAAALEGAGPASMLRRLNDALIYGSTERQLAAAESTVRFVTVSVVALTPDERGFGAVVANGGHPPPILIRPDGAVEHLAGDGPLLGVFDAPSFPECRTHLGLSDVLVLYTDGVTEQRRQADLFDEAQVGRLVRNMLTVQHADDIARIILDTAVVLNPQEVRDDIALVVARVTGPR